MASEFKTLVDVFQRAVAGYGPRTLFGTKRNGEWSWITYAEFGAMVDRARAGLAARGVRPGECVAMVSNNRVEWAVVAYACYGLGAAFVPMYEAQSPKEWEFIIAECEAVLLVLPNDAVARKVPALVDGTAGGKLRGVVLLDATPGVVQPAGGRVTPFSALIAPGERADSIQPGPDDLATLIYTSGTTGVPKGVMLTHGNIASNVSAIHKVLQLDSGDRSLAFLPWAHVFGQTAELHHLLAAGASMAICEGREKLLENLVEIRPTLLFSVPLTFNRLYTAVQGQIAAKPPIVRKLVDAALRVTAKQREGKAVRLDERALLRLVDALVFRKVRARFGGRLRYVSSGGAALSREVAEFIDSLGIVVYEGYGLTETSPVVSTNYPGMRKFGTVGKPIPGVRVAVDALAVHGGGDQASKGVEGEIVVFGPNVMKGYFKRPEETQAVFTPERGFRTGDMGFLDDDGFLSITGRIKEQYKLENGKYVVPTALEDQLRLSPFVANAMVYGDNRPHNIALVVANLAAVRKWAAEAQLPTEDADALLAHERTRALFRAEIERCSAAFRGFEKIRNFALLAEDFGIENGLLTPKLSLKRRAVTERYKDIIEGLYREEMRAAPGLDRSVSTPSP